MDPDHLRLTPTAGVSAPAAWMTLSCLLVYAGTVVADGNGCSTVALGWRHEPDTAVAVLIVVPAHERRHQGASLLDALEWPAWVVRPVSHGAEQGLGVGVVVAHPRPGEGSEHAQLLQSALQRGGPHCVAVIGMEDQRLGPPLADPLSQVGPADQIGGDLGLLSLGHVPGHHLAAPDVDHQVEVQPHTTDTDWQVGDVPAPDLIGPAGFQPGHRARLLRRPGTATVMDLAMGVEHAVEAAL